jgi:hypothetical protein
MIGTNCLKTGGKMRVLGEKIAEFEITGQTDDRLCANGPATKRPMR